MRNIIVDGQKFKIPNKKIYALKIKAIAYVEGSWTLYQERSGALPDFKMQDADYPDLMYPLVFYTVPQGIISG